MSDKCAGCGNPVVGSGYWKEATAWYQVRPRGANQMKRKQDTGRVVCHACMVARESGIARGQEKMI